MATGNETDTAGTQGARIATEMLARSAIKAHKAKARLLRQIHFDNELDGAKAAKKDYLVRADGGAGSAGPGEATAHSANTEITMGTSVSVTPTEAYSDLAVLSFDMMQQAIGATSAQLQRLIDEDNPRLWMSLIREDVGFLIGRGIQKMEADALANFASVTAKVGSTGVDATITNLLTAIYTGNTQQPIRPVQERKFFLTPNQVHEVNLEALATSGGLNGIWQGKDSSFTDNQPDGGYGREGSFLGYEVIAYDHEQRVLVNTNADVRGVFGHLGVPGVAPDNPSLAGAVGAFVFAERSPLRVTAKYDVDRRALVVQCGARYDTALIDDNGVVAIETDAP